jgi:hypothetical protein
MGAQESFLAFFQKLKTRTVGQSAKALKSDWCSSGTSLQQAAHAFVLRKASSVELQICIAAGGGYFWLDQ